MEYNEQHTTQELFSDRNVCVCMYMLPLNWAIAYYGNVGHPLSFSLSQFLTFTSEYFLCMHLEHLEQGLPGLTLVPGDYSWFPAQLLSGSGRKVG